MSMIFYGVGKCGKSALEAYVRKENKNEILKGFADSKKKGTCCGYPILSISDIKKEDNVVITIINLQIVVEIYYQLKMRGINQIYWFTNQNVAEGNQDFLKERCIDCSTWGNCVLPNVEMHIADHCNLNCKGCAHFSPLFGTELPDFESRILDVKQVKEKVSHIACFSILGGEPFLNPDIGLYISEIRKILPNTFIQIVTNGLLIPKLNNDILECIKKNQIVVSISEYEPTHRIIGSIEEKLKKYGITYEIRRYESKQKFIKPLSIKNNSIYPNKCISNGCVNIWNGKIARCPTLMYIDRFNEQFGEKLPNEGIMQLKDCPSGSELIEILRREVPLCKHCVGYEMEWEQCSKKLTVMDFACVD